MAISKSGAIDLSAEYQLASLKYATADGGVRLDAVISALADKCRSVDHGHKIAAQIRRDWSECPTYAEVMEIFRSAYPVEEKRLEFGNERICTAEDWAESSKTLPPDVRAIWESLRGTDKPKPKRPTDFQRLKEILDR